MKAIVAADLNWGIGYRGDLLARIPEDMKFFKQTTLGKIVIMGRTTFESLPGKEPLKDRLNLVLSENPSFQNSRVKICHSLDELFLELKKYPPDDVFVIGGEAVYRQLLPFCTEAYVTRLENIYPADRYFVNLDHDGNWELRCRSEMKSHNNIRYSFKEYVNGKLLTYGSSN